MNGVLSLTQYFSCCSGEGVLLSQRLFISIWGLRIQNGDLISIYGNSGFRWSFHTIFSWQAWDIWVSERVVTKLFWGKAMLTKHAVRLRLIFTLLQKHKRCYTKVLLENHRPYASAFNFHSTKMLSTVGNYFDFAGFAPAVSFELCSAVNTWR